MGRLFDTVAALLGFTGAITFEGQAAIWVEQLARNAPPVAAYPFPFDGRELDFRPLLEAVVSDRLHDCPPNEIARNFQQGLANGISDAAARLCAASGLNTVVLSGGVIQNELLLRDLKPLLEKHHLQAWVNHVVPSNDGGISLGQAALAAFGRFDTVGQASIALAGQLNDMN